MRKIIIVCLLAAVVFAGCLKQRRILKPENRPPRVNRALPKVTDEMDKELENKLKAIDDMGKDVIDNIRQSKQGRVGDKGRYTHNDNNRAVAGTEEIELNVESKSDLGTLGFRSVKIDYENKLLIIKIEPSDKSKTHQICQCRQKRS